MTVGETAALFAHSGLDCAEICFCQTDLSGWKFNFSGYRSLPDTADIRRAVCEFSDNGVSVVSIGLYNCLWQGGAGGFSESLRYFCEYCDAAKEAGADMICTHSGTTDMWLGGGRIPDNYRESVFECFACALTEAYKRGITVALECGSTDALKDYNDYLLLKEYIRNAVGTDNMLKYIGVPCNGEKYDKHDTALFHLKDRKNDGRYYECFGKGDADFSEFFGNITDSSDIPIILEYVNGSNIREVAKLVRYRNNNRI